MSVGGAIPWTDRPGARYLTTERDDGDFSIDGDPAGLDAARRGVVDLPWVWLRQVHGTSVFTVERGREAAVRGLDGDALVTADTGVALAVQTADCVPVVFGSPEGVIGVAHAGWRGLAGGVLEATAGVMRSLGAGAIEARIGPCIGVECYEFGTDDLDRLVQRLGPGVVGATTSGRPALDAAAAARAALAVSDVVVPVGPYGGVGPSEDVVSMCTSCARERWFSHRARHESGRMATVVWRDRLESVGGGA